MRRELASGSLLIAGGLAGVAVMALHPVAPVARMNVGWGLVAVLTAAIASGFVAPAMIHDHALLDLTAHLNQGFAKVNLVASSVGILLFGAAILKTGRLSRGVGALGIVMPAVLLVLFFVGHITVDLHGFGIVVFAQSAWLLWIGALLCRSE